MIRCSRSKRSGKLVFPPVPAQSSAAHLYADATVENRAVLYSFTTIHPNPKSGQAPFSLIYADFSGSLRVFGRLGGAPGTMPQIGMALRMSILQAPDTGAEEIADAPGGPGRYLLEPIAAA